MLDTLLESLGCREYHQDLLAELKNSDLQIHELIAKEFERQQYSLQLIAAENQCSRAALAALGSIVQNKTTEGFPKERFHAGCEFVDQIEQIAVTRACEAFGAEYANVQPHSGTAANQIVLSAVLDRGDKILSLGLDQGGHLSHGADASFTGKFFEVENYNVDRETLLLDYDAIGKKAQQFKPKLIICGATAYSRTIDFGRFREIADSVGAYLLADVSHISGLIMASAHPSPIDYAHFTTSSTYKPGGPRGGIILMGRDSDTKVTSAPKQLTLSRLIQKTTFPGIQGTPYLNNIAAKAVFFKEARTEEYKTRQSKIIENAKNLSRCLLDRGFNVLTGGTDNHMILINVADFKQGLTGLAAQESLEKCSVIVNKNKLPYDQKSASITSGIRLGTPIVTRNGMGKSQMREIADIVDEILSRTRLTGPNQYDIDESFTRQKRDHIRELCTKFPIH